MLHQKMNLAKLTDRSGRYMPDEYFELKANIHDRLLDMIDLSIIDKLDREALNIQIRKVVEKILREESFNLPLNMVEREKIFSEIIDEVLGYGPLEPLLKDPTISDILVNTYKNIYVERLGKLEPTDARFKDDAHLMRIIDKIVSSVGRRIDESSPMVDARLPDGSRVNAIIPPLALDGPILSIRRFAVNPLELDDLINYQTLTPGIAELLKGIVKAKLNVLISGGTGSGKTTLLNVLSRFIPADERIVTIEDAAELQLKQEHVVRLETRPPNIEGKGQVTQRDLVRNSLRMRPDRIIVGEVRGERGLRHAPGHEHRPRRVADHHPRQLRPGFADAAGDHGGHGQHGDPQRVFEALHLLGHQRHHPGLADGGRPAQDRERPGDHRHGGQHHHHAGDFLVPAAQDRPGRQRQGGVPLSRDPAAFCRKIQNHRDQHPPGNLRSRQAR